MRESDYKMFFRFCTFFKELIEILLVVVGEDLLDGVIDQLVRMVEASKGSLKQEMNDIIF